MGEKEKQVAEPNCRNYCRCCKNPKGTSRAAFALCSPQGAPLIIISLLSFSFYSSPFLHANACVRVYVRIFVYKNENENVCQICNMQV